MSQRNPAGRPTPPFSFPTPSLERGTVVAQTLDPDNLEWRKSSFSGSNGCVELASLEGNRVALRDSKNPAAGFFVYTPHEWISFVKGVRNGEFDGLVRPETQ